MHSPGEEHLCTPKFKIYFPILSKKTKKLSGSKIEDTSAASANGSTNVESQTTNRSPTSSAPQDVVDVGSAAPNARKRGWWSRG